MEQTQTFPNAGSRKFGIQIFIIIAFFAGSFIGYQFALSKNKPPQQLFNNNITSFPIDPYDVAVQKVGISYLLTGSVNKMLYKADSSGEGYEIELWGPTGKSFKQKFFVPITADVALWDFSSKKAGAKFNIHKIKSHDQVMITLYKDMKNNSRNVVHTIYLTRIK